MGELQMEPGQLSAQDVPWQHTTSLCLRYAPDRGFGPENNFIPAIQDDGLFQLEHRGETWGHLTELVLEL